MVMNMHLTRKSISFFISIVVFLTGATMGIRYYNKHVLPPNEARPILKALRANDPVTALANPEKPQSNLLKYIGAGGHLLTGRAAQIVRYEFLHLLQNSEDINCRRMLLNIIMISTQDPTASRIQFEAEDWDIIAQAVDRMNIEERRGTNTFSVKWSIREHEGRKILRDPIPPSP